MATVNTLLTGAAFGAALTASGVYQPSVIVSQLKFENWHMIQTFLTAAATSASLVAAVQRTGIANLQPRSYSSIGLFARYDGNIVGGLLLGAGMMLAGACPGTVLAQVGVGVRSGYYALGGAALGGIAFIRYIQPHMTSCAKQSPAPKHEIKTVHEGLGVPRSVVFLAFEAVCASVIAATAVYTTVGPEAKISPILGGLLITSAQLISVLLRGSLIGTSASFEEIGHWFWDLFKGDLLPKKYTNLLFVAAMSAGAYLISKVFPALGEVSELAVSPFSATVGGFLMIIGARMAGGCTSGHGLSGISLLSISSFLSIGACFVGGGLTGLLLG
ncbi:hypothetical protein V8F33_009312 [Rhypophila sp. PSN 637]